MDRYCGGCGELIHWWQKTSEGRDYWHWRCWNSWEEGRLTQAKFTKSMLTIINAPLPEDLNTIFGLTGINAEILKVKLRELRKKYNITTYYWPLFHLQDPDGRSKSSSKPLQKGKTKRGLSSIGASMIKPTKRNRN